MFHAGTFLSAICFFGLVGMSLALLLQIFIVNSQYRSCVVLPNGLTVGYEAWIAPGRNLWQPGVVLKSPIGSTLVADDLDLFYFSATTAYGHDRNDENSFDIAYRADTGLVLGEENPDLYHRLIDEAGPLLEEGKSLQNSNLLHVYYQLRDVSAYGKNWCRLSFFPHMAGDGMTASGG